MKLAYVSLEVMDIQHDILGRTNHLLSFDTTDYSASNRNEYQIQKMFLGSKVRRVRRADNLTTSEPIV
jgi:hypothetical protein